MPRRGGGPRPTAAESTPPVRGPSSLEALLSDLQRAKAALRLAMAADLCLKSGDDEALIALGFARDPIAGLRAGPSGGYPPYALRNLRSTIRWLESARAAHSADPTPTPVA